MGRKKKVEEDEEEEVYHVGEFPLISLDRSEG
jgi:hypothetical protein